MHKDKTLHGWMIIHCLSSLFLNCIQNDVTTQHLCLSVRFKKPRPILLVSINNITFSWQCDICFRYEARLALWWIPILNHSDATKSRYNFLTVKVFFWGFQKRSNFIFTKIIFQKFFIFFKLLLLYLICDDAPGVYGELTDDSISFWESFLFDLTSSLFIMILEWHYLMCYFSMIFLTLSFLYKPASPYFYVKRWYYEIERQCTIVIFLWIWYGMI